MEMTEQTYTIEELDKLMNENTIEILDVVSVPKDTFRHIEVTRIKPTQTDTGIRFDYLGFDKEDNHKIQFSSWGVKSRSKPSEILTHSCYIKNNGTKFLSLEIN